MSRITLDSGVPAELARGRTGGRGVVMNPDIGGLRPLFDDLCTHLAETYGWTVCAVEPFPGRESMSLDERLAAMAELDDATQVGRLVEAADVIGTEPVAVLGFCMGGMYALKAAATGRFDKAVSFYGMIRVPADWHGSAQHDAIDMLAGAEAPSEVLAIIGGRDHFTPPGDVDDLEAWGATVVRYPEAEHGFVHDPSRPTYRPDDSADAWQRTVEFLRLG